jgi:hypothetical protein
VLRLEQEGATAVAADIGLRGAGTDSDSDSRAGSGEERYALLISRYADDSAAGRAWEQLQRDLDPYLSVLEESEHRLVLEDHAGRFMLVEIKGPTIELRHGLIHRPA